MAKKVRYIRCCSDSKDLIVGKEYEVILSRERNSQTYYTLKGVDGEYSSTWFDEITIDDKIYLGFARNLPVVGERFICYKMTLVDGHPQLTYWSTSPVRKFIHVGSNIYQVVTRNSTYIVNVG